MTTQTQNKSFILHKDSLSVLNKLTDEQAGKLFKSIFIYQTENVLPDDNLISIIFEPFLNQFKRDVENYKKTCEARKIAGSKGGKQKVANATKNKQKVANVAVNDSVSVSVNVNVINIEERKQKFASSLQPFVEKYGREFIKEFYLYWSEPTLDNKKLKYELEKTWSLERRLIKWGSNAKKFGTILPIQEQTKFKAPWQ